MRVQRLALTSLFCLPLFAGNATANVGIDASEGLSLPQIENHEEAELIASTLDGQLPRVADEPLGVTFGAFGRSFDLLLTPSPIIDPAVTRTFVAGEAGEEEILTENYSYWGEVLGDDGSSVAVTLMHGALKGLVQTSDDMYVLEPRALYDSAADGASVIVYRVFDNPIPDFEDEADILSTLDEPSAESDQLHFSRTARRGHAIRHASGYLRRRHALTDVPQESMVLTNGQLQRYDIGTMADFPFYSVVHQGNETAAIQDMDATVNTVSMLYRDSVLVALRVGGRKVYTSAAAQAADGIASCPLTCKTATSFSPGNKCTSNSDCSSGTCQQIPTPYTTCASGTPNAGKACLGIADCGNISGSCSGPTIGARVCDRGSNDGKVCTSSSQCGSGFSCQTLATRARFSAGRYRTCNNCGHTIDTANTGTVHLFSGCQVYAGEGSPVVCGSEGAGSCSTDQHLRVCLNAPHVSCITNSDCTAAQAPCVKQTALLAFSTFGHEIGHGLIATGEHDDGASCGAYTGAGLRVTREACAGGTNKDKMCTDAAAATDCPGSTCSIANTRLCTNAVASVCVDDSDCGGGGVVCQGPRNRRCIGGTTPGQTCNASYRTCVGGSNPGTSCYVEAPVCSGGGTCTGAYSMCGGGGTCTGAPMNWRVYFMGGGGWGGFSPCSKSKIATTLSGNPVCLADISCGDVNLSGPVPNARLVCYGGSSPGVNCNSNTDCGAGGACNNISITASE